LTAEWLDVKLVVPERPGNLTHINKGVIMYLERLAAVKELMVEGSKVHAVNMETWGVGNINDLVADLVNGASAEDVFECGTTACIAGWTNAFVFNTNTAEYMRAIQNVGYSREKSLLQAFLGLTTNEATSLCYPDSQFWRNFGAEPENKEDLNSPWVISDEDLFRGLDALINGEVTLADEGTE